MVHITQGTFSYLPELTDDQIVAQVEYAIQNEWSLQVEFTDDPHPRNIYWHMWGVPMFELKDGAGALQEVKRCIEAYPNNYIRVTCYNAKLLFQTTALQFIVHRPAEEPGFRLSRREAHDRVIQYELYPYAADKPHGERYQNGNR